MQYVTSNELQIQLEILSKQLGESTSELLNIINLAVQENDKKINLLLIKLIENSIIVDDSNPLNINTRK